ncbi:hypothetical protein I0K15_08910 [Pontivivens ytuae]|uniref:DUF3299 domain-containing protein n=2 Tax=Pontivivens ytuae TaxID=2789856 RepID=A0A7S9LVX7_9RHOB|nr:hypothetical protein I0K15_08910 [Pontivivens ytuae]
MDRRLFLATSLAAPYLAAAPLRAQEEGSAEGDALRMRDLYNRDRSFSDLARDLQGQRIEVEGFMAPPLLANSVFFVLTKRPMSVCPFCETAAEWPDDILAVYSKRVVRPTPFNVRIETRGVLEIGDYRDPETGFLSRVRLSDATFGRA